MVRLLNHLKTICTIQTVSYRLHHTDCKSDKFSQEKDTDKAFEGYQAC